MLENHTLEFSADVTSQIFWIKIGVKDTLLDLIKFSCCSKLDS
jgi:hypothetical protein